MIEWILIPLFPLTCSWTRKMQSQTLMKMGEMNTMNFTCQYEQAAICLLVLSWHCGISCSPRAVPAVAFELIVDLVQLAAESQPSQKLQTRRELGQGRARGVAAFLWTDTEYNSSHYHPCSFWTDLVVVLCHILTWIRRHLNQLLLVSCLEKSSRLNCFAVGKIAAG